MYMHGIQYANIAQLLHTKIEKEEEALYDSL